MIGLRKRAEEKKKEAGKEKERYEKRKGNERKRIENKEGKNGKKMNRWKTRKEWKRKKYNNIKKIKKGREAKRKKEENNDAIKYFLFKFNDYSMIVKIHIFIVKNLSRITRIEIFQRSKYFSCSFASKWRNKGHRWDNRIRYIFLKNLSNCKNTNFVSRFKYLSCSFASKWRDKGHRWEIWQISRRDQNRFGLFESPETLNSDKSKMPARQVAKMVRANRSSLIPNARRIQCEPFLCTGEARRSIPSFHRVFPFPIPRHWIHFACRYVFATQNAAQIRSYSRPRSYYPGKSHLNCSLVESSLK